MLDTADCRSISSRLSAEWRQDHFVLPFPQAAEELQAQLSTAGFPMLYSPQPGREEQSQHKASPPLGPLPGPPGMEGHCRLESPSTQQHLSRQQPPANSHTRELLAGGQPWKGQKLCSSALLVLPSRTMGLQTLCTLPLCQTTWMGAERPKPACACASGMPHMGQCQRWQEPGRGSAELPAPVASYLLWAAKQSSVFPQPRADGLLQAQQAAGLTPHREDTTRLLEPGRDFIRGTERHLQAWGQPKSALALCKPPWHTQSRGRAASLDENHIYFTDTELHWWSILHTLGRQQQGPTGGPGHWGQNSHREICFF